jgi:hypothetical protein
VIDPSEGTGWSKDLPEWLKQLELVPTHTSTQPIVSTYVTRTKDRDYYMITWDCVNTSYQYSQIKYDYAERLLDDYRKYRKYTTIDQFFPAPSVDWSHTNFADLEAKTTSLNKTNRALWLKTKQAAKADSFGTSDDALRKDREKNACIYISSSKLFLVDKEGRIIRRSTPLGDCYYFTETLKKRIEPTPKNDG